MTDYDAERSAFRWAAAWTLLRDAPDLFAGMARVRARLATGAYPPLQAGAEPEAEERVEGMV